MYNCIRFILIKYASTEQKYFRKYRQFYENQQIELIVIKYGKDETAKKKTNSQEIAHVNWMKKYECKSLNNKLIITIQRLF